MSSDQEQHQRCWSAMVAVSTIDHAVLHVLETSDVAYSPVQVWEAAPLDQEDLHHLGVQAETHGARVLQLAGMDGKEVADRMEMACRDQRVLPEAVQPRIEAVEGEKPWCSAARCHCYTDVA